MNPVSVPVAVRSAEFAGSNPAGGMISSRECFVLSGRVLCGRADHSSIRVLPTVVCLSVIYKSQK